MADKLALRRLSYQDIKKPENIINAFNENKMKTELFVNSINDFQGIIYDGTGEYIEYGWLTYSQQYIDFNFVNEYEFEPICTAKIQVAYNTEGYIGDEVNQSSDMKIIPMAQKFNSSTNFNGVRVYIKGTSLPEYFPYGKISITAICNGKVES